LFHPLDIWRKQEPEPYQDLMPPPTLFNPPKACVTSSNN
jgi:hypothetical protein